MKTLSFLLVILLCSYAVTAQLMSPGIFYPGTADKPGASGPYFGQIPPGTTPKRFAPAKIPAGAWGISFSPDGMECIITNIIDSMQTLLTSKDTGEGWPDMAVAPFSGNWFDMESVISPDGLKVFFGSMRPLPGFPSGLLYQWYVEKTETGWSDAKPMEPPLCGLSMMFPSLAGNRNMYYTATDGISSQWIALSRFVNGAYTEPVKLDDSVNSTSSPAHPFIAPDERYIIFDALTDTTNGARDLYICYRKPDSTWTRAINLGTKINNATYSMFPFVSRDNKYFFFYKDNYMMWVDAGFIEQMRPRYGAYLGETPPDTIPELFAADFIAPPPNEVYSCTFSPDGNEFYYSNYSGNANKIWKTELVNNRWTTPAVAPFLQSPWTIEPNFSPDGQSLYFVSTMPDNPPGPPYNTNLRIWAMNKSDSGWTTPHVLQGPFSDSLKMFPSVASNRNLYFTEAYNNRGKIYKSEWTFGGGYQTPVKLDSSINRFMSQAHPFIAPDESFLLFDANPEGPPEWKSYIYISYRNQDGTWQEARKLSATINATGGEYCGSISPDMKYLFFARNKPEGGTNLWWVKAGNIIHPLGTNDLANAQDGKELLQNYPNPAHEMTTIGFNLEKPDHIRIVLYDICGKMVRTLAEGEMNTGKHFIRLDTRDLTSGVYWYSLISGNTSLSKSMIILRE
jgi:hypothetical protein